MVVGSFANLTLARDKRFTEAYYFSKVIIVNIYEEVTAWQLQI